MSEWSPLDRALRDLAQAEPPRHLHARVMARIEEPAASGWQIRWSAALAVPSMIAVVLVGAVWMSRGPESVPSRPSGSIARIEHPAPVGRHTGPVDRLRQGDGASAEAAAKAGVGRHNGVVQATPVLQSRRAQGAQVETGIDQPDPESSIPAHERPQPIALAAIPPTPVEVRAMETVADLTIAPLGVDPLAVPDPKQP